MQLNSSNSIKNIIVAPMKLPVRVTSMRSRKGLGDPPVLRGLLSSGPAMIDVQNQFFRFGDDVWIQSQNLVVLIYKMCFSDLYNFCIQGGGAYLHKEFLSCLLSTNAIGGNSFYRRFFSWSAKLVVLFEWYLSFFFFAFDSRIGFLWCGNWIFPFANCVAPICKITNMSFCEMFSSGLYNSCNWGVSGFVQWFLN